MEEFKKPIPLPKMPPKKFEQEIFNELDPKQNKNTKQRKFEVPYIEPTWSAKPENQNIEYKFEVLKAGSIIEKVRNLQTKSYWLFGRLEENDVILAHPTISRFHAVFQFRPDEKSETNLEEISEDKKTKIESGWYIYDLGSTHGTFVNKQKIPSKTYVRVRVGHMIKFGASLRSFILQGPDFDEEPESELTVTELIERKKQEQDFKEKQQELLKEKNEQEGISWGMTDDAEEETDLSENPYASTNNEELFLDDPKKTLRGFFEREGLPLEYKCDEMSPGTFVCRVELPIEDNAKPVVAEVCHKGKKKECVVQCALEACRILDRHGVLRQSHHEPLKRKIVKSDSDDDDDFLDRTGDIERKKQRKANAGQSTTLTYDDLVKKEKELILQIDEVEKEISNYHENIKKNKETEANLDDDLDNYMENLAKKSTSVDKTQIRKLRVEEQRLKADLQKTRKLIKITKPLDLPEFSSNEEKKQINSSKSASLPLFGKRNMFKFQLPKSQKKAPEETQISKNYKSDEEEFDEDDENQEESEKNKSLLNENIVEKKQIKNEINDNVENKSDISDFVNLEKDKKLSAKQYAPASIPPELLKTKKEEALEQLPTTLEKKENDEKSEENEIGKTEDVDMEKIEPIKEWIVSTNAEAVETEDLNTEEEKPENKIEEELNNDLNKKKKNRVRNRHLRDQVDIDDYEEYIDLEKHSEWVPPKNQSGDGRTALNDKFGY